MGKNKKRRLLFTAYNLDIGGIESALVNLLNYLDYNKYDVDLILEKREGVLLDKINKNVRVKEIAVSDNKNILVRKFINLFRKLKFTVFNYHKYDFSCCYATYSLSSNKIARIASSNNSIYVHSNYKYVYKKEEDFILFFESRNIRDFRKIIFVSNESCDDFCNLYPELKEKLVVFNNFINVNEIKKLSNVSIEQKRKKDKVLFTFVGRLDDCSKKLGRAINLVKNIEKIELWIVGDGPDRKKYENLVNKNKLSDRVKFVGKKNNPYPYIKECDYFVLTSDYEGFPVTYLEAIALEKPIITTIDVSDDKINIGKDYGYIVSKDENKMVDEIESILDHPREMKYISLEKLQSKRIKELEEIFDEVI